MDKEPTHNTVPGVSTGPAPPTEAPPEEQLRQFLRQTSYASQGGIVTDLDGTVVHEDQGRIVIPQAVELALKDLYDLGRPLLLNTLRFPLSVLRTFGRDWCRLANAPIPTVSMNGSQLGFITRTAQDELRFEEILAFPLTAGEIEEILQGVRGLLEGGINELLVFYYPRDWRMGEIIWTPLPEQVLAVKEKYVSASSVTAVELTTLHAQMLAQEICMVFLLIDAPQDTLMAYQHAKRSNFFTHQGVDKRFGSQRFAAELGLDLTHSVGAGDTEMDSFLGGVGLALLIGNHDLEFRGVHQTIKLRNSLELGQLLSRFAAIQRELLRQGTATKTTLAQDVHRPATPAPSATTAPPATKALQGTPRGSGGAANPPAVDGTREQELARQVIEHFFGNKPVSVEPQSGGKNNFVFQVDHREGQFVVRLSPDPDKFDVYRKEQWAVDRARQAGVPTPTILEVGNHPAPWAYMIATSSEGQIALCHEKRLSILRDMGRYTALINAIPTRGFGDVFDWADEQVPRHATWREFLERELNLEARLECLQRHDMLPSSQLLTLRSMLESLSERSPSTTLNHGDIRLKNVLADEAGRITAILDWEHSMSNLAPYWELSIALHDLAIDEKEKFLQGYGLPADELRAIAPILTALNIINYVPSIVAAAKRNDAARLEQYRTRLSGALALSSLQSAQ